MGFSVISHKYLLIWNVSGKVTKTVQKPFEKVNLMYMLVIIFFYHYFFRKLKKKSLLHLINSVWTSGYG